ncbi:MAG: hypothetical protein E6J16_07320 [Chloroflexota bacterium]|nr:MAG: hypothetical protein E6J16_07320 [Chloroflexota bacterium]TMD84652.1 MAG: hypothetical protein E6I78_10265 [Chloroflexota bacterium]
MTSFRIALSVFAILNVVFWALLAWTWAVKPAWAARLPLGLGSDKRYQSAVPVWARLAAAIAAFWAVAAVLYLTVYSGDRLAFVALFTMAAIFLILAIGAAARVYTVLQLPKDSMMGMPRRQQAR